jgi:hypothetical protein
MTNNRKTTEKFIEEATVVHGQKFDYSKVEYKTNKDKVCIICPSHGPFYQRAIDHLSSIHGCPTCAAESMKSKIYGVGINDLPNKTTHPLYSVWRGMIQRCKSGNIKKYPTYQGCDVSDEWLIFSSFYEWAIANIPPNLYIFTLTRIY